MENEKLALDTALALAHMMGNREWVFKASFDKANRTSISGRRGPGLAAGIAILAKIRDALPGVPLTTDIHEPWQAGLLEGLIDIAQIPAFLCRQTDLVVKCARHFPTINVKKGQWLSPENTVATVDKIRGTNPNAKAWLTERGTVLGTDHLVVDATTVDLLRTGWDEVILDCTHSTQRERALHGAQGDPILAGRYLAAAPLLGYTGVFAETHPDPPSAISDADCQLPLNRVPGLLDILDASEELARRMP